MDFIYGLHHSLSQQEYRGLDAIGKSDLDLIAKSPAHFKCAVREETAAMTLGSAVHCAVLEPDRFAMDYVMAPGIDRRTKVGKEQFAEFEAANHGKTVLSMEDGMLCHHLAQSVLSHALAAPLLVGAMPEVSALWSDAEFNVRCRARFDALTPGGWIIDLKTTTDSSPRGFAKSVANFRYHVQAAWYLDGYQIATGGDLPVGFLFVAVEKTPPYAVALYELDAESLEQGRMVARRDLARYANARDLDHWGGYSEAIQTLSLPRWAMTNDINAEE